VDYRDLQPDEDDEKDMTLPEISEVPDVPTLRISEYLKE
jgi:hypothetical protein